MVCPHRGSETSWSSMEFVNHDVLGVTECGHLG
jgi:hypothetical protein